RRERLLLDGDEQRELAEHHERRIGQRQRVDLVQRGRQYRRGPQRHADRRGPDVHGAAGSRELLLLAFREFAERRGRRRQRLGEREHVERLLMDGGVERVVDRRIFRRLRERQRIGGVLGRGEY